MPSNFGLYFLARYFEARSERARKKAERLQSIAKHLRERADAIFARIGIFRGKP